jgi:hypothetical protein
LAWPRTDAGGASLLLNLEGLATMALAWVIFRENVDQADLIQLQNLVEEAEWQTALGP